MTKQTILGAGGAIGVELAKALPKYTDKIRLVSRNPQKVNEKDELMKADLLNPKEVDKAINGSSVVYVTIGFPYSYKFWKANWAPFMRSVIDACKRHDAKLVFFDNIYMYDQNHLNGMTEETPINPPSKKGEVRAELVKMIMDEVDKGTLTALIARAADFYGPGIKNTSVLTEMVIDPLSKGKPADWMGSVHFKHAFTYTPDAGKATALLGNTDSAFNQVWHMPTAKNAPSGKEWIEQIASAFNTKPKHRVASKFILKMIGIFIPVLREMPEMIYQYDRDYVFNSDKFEKAFNFKPTSYEDGLKEIIKTDYPN
ncbi:NAD-dependent epimerase/dehydratase family protein [uncultured Draconibacterium sp.]|uniref:NAD-dependent epimerase/dehydratase family protein n=1 Tax=uncultured Draconibacterium sp. TaxID=1573823 RepID=UPI0029C681C4|nr:NAD-dependent epimerase/dehydratase family protein [uncultured Draconibacterium sp.]